MDFLDDVFKLLAEGVKKFGRALASRHAKGRIPKGMTKEDLMAKYRIKRKARNARASKMRAIQRRLDHGSRKRQR